MAQSRANYYTAGSPVQFVRVELLKGDVTGEVAVCLTFKNVGTEPLTGFIIHFKCKDASGQILCEDDFYYEQLNVQPGELFGADDAVFVSDTPVSSVEIEQDRAFRESNMPPEEICRTSVYELALSKLDKTAARLTFEILSESTVNPRIKRAVKLYDATWHEILLPIYRRSGRLSEEEAKTRLEADLALMDGLYFRAVGNEAVDCEALARRVSDRIWLSLTGDALA